jgi:hypothetical protein
LLFIFSLVLGPAVGVLGSLFVLLCVLPGGNQDHADLLDEVSQVSKTQVPDEKRKIRFKPLGEAFEILSYQQIIRGKDLDLKLKLMSLLALNPSEQSVSLLRLALDDSDETIRVLAGTCLEKLDDHFMTSVMKIGSKTDDEKVSSRDGLIGAYLETEDRKIPPGQAAGHFKKFMQQRLDSFTPSRDKTSLELAKAYRDYLRSGLVPEQSRKHFRELLICHCFEGLEQNPSNTELFREVSAMAMEFKELSLLRLSLDLYLQANGDPAEIIWEEARYLYEQQEYKGVKKVLKQELKNESNLGIREIRALNWWRG